MAGGASGGVDAALVVGDPLGAVDGVECAATGSESGAWLEGACDIRATAVVDRTSVRAPATTQDDAALTRLPRCPRTLTSS